ncbi:MAG TPA: response regulator transcription factor [Armatimonadota bacterium]|jgi:DNA-binding NarL/FixJ family response regulator
MDRIRVLLIEDEGLLRNTLAELLRLQEDMEVVGEGVDGEHGVKIALAQRPDIVLTDLQMPRMDGIAATRAIKEALPQTAVVVLTNFDDEERLFGALKAGAIGYILKSASLPEVADGIRSAYRGEGVLPPTLVSRVMHEFARQSVFLEKHHEVFSELTRREVEILQLVGSGARNRDIAEKLFLSERTVKNHVSSILSKLHVNSRTEAALLATKYGLTGP